MRCVDCGDSIYFLFLLFIAQIPNTNIVIEKGTVVYMTLKGLHEDPEFHPDPMRYDPDRFSDERKDDIRPCTYMPFGDGPRICIGETAMIYLLR